MCAVRAACHSVAIRLRNERVACVAQSPLCRLFWEVTIDRTFFETPVSDTLTHTIMVPPGRSGDLSVVGDEARAHHLQQQLVGGEHRGRFTRVVE